jgi:hypothetical protein
MTLKVPAAQGVHVDVEAPLAEHEPAGHCAEHAVPRLVAVL